MSGTSPAILVLGASGALGSRLAARLAADGNIVVGTASSPASLAKVPANLADQIVVDLRSPASCAQLVDRLRTTYPAITGVVVASGVVGFAPAESTPSDLAADMMAINHSGPAQIISSLLPHLQLAEVGSAFVLGITGVVVEQTFPGMSAYTASKHAHSSYLASIAKEWRRHKIAAIDVRLGHTETGLAAHPLFGTAPQMPAGHDQDHVVDVIVQAIGSRELLVPSTAF